MFVFKISNADTVVLITLHPSVDISRFLYRNESYEVKEGVRTTTIRQERRKEKVIKITGLHHNTKDQAVVKYLAAHGPVSTKEKVIHYVFPGEPGSKLNGNRRSPSNMLVRNCARYHHLKRDCHGVAVHS